MQMPNISLMELYNRLAQQQALFGEKIEKIYDVISGSLQLPMDITNSNDYPSLWPDNGLNVYAILPEYNLAENLCTSGVVFNIGQGRYKYQMMIVQEDELHSEKNGKLYYRYSKSSEDEWSGWKRTMYSYELTGGRDADGKHYKDDFGNMLTDTEDNDPDINGEYSDEDDVSKIFDFDEETGDIVVTDEDNEIPCTYKLFTNTDLYTVSPIENVATDGDFYNTNFKINTLHTNEVVITEPSTKSLTLLCDRSYTADTLTKSRNITLTGDVTGQCSFDGSEDVTIKVNTNNLIPININLPAQTCISTTYRLLCTLPSDTVTNYNYISIKGHLGGFSTKEGKCNFDISASNCGSIKINSTITGNINKNKIDIIALKNLNSTAVYFCLVTYQYCNIDDVKMSIIGSDKIIINNEIINLQENLQIPTEITNNNEILPLAEYKIWSLADDSIKFEGQDITGNLLGNATTSDTSKRANVVNILPRDDEELHIVGINSALSEHFYDTNISITKDSGGLTLKSITGDSANINTINSNDITCQILNTNTFKADMIYNTVANDYAEYFPRGGDTEFGDVIMLNPNADKEEYIKAQEIFKCNEDTYCVIGVQSDTYGHILGGCEGTEEEKLQKYIPVGLAGRVNVKFIGKAKKGAKVVPSINGCARMFNKNLDNLENVIGYLVEDDNIEDFDTVRRLKMKIK